MEKQTTSDRLKQIMKERNLRQVDILEMCKPYCKKYNVKLGRNDLSQYVSGKVEPGQKKLTVLGTALNVSEAWLMGFDVPMQRNIVNEKDIDKTVETLFEFTKELDINNEFQKKFEQAQARFTRISAYLSMLNDSGKDEAVKRVQELTCIPKYQKKPTDSAVGKNIEDLRKIIAGAAIDAAHARTDTEITEEMKKHDDDIMNDENF